ncbi:DUF6228 family protein [Streptomyces violaceusniger]|uniref:Uncharacterized protein n=1 Tax=Streptomyces violaceusniger (strain Tu 4113) TaxID=653045 RepID=G2NU58_STRV4|nr:DUF6228 family protein [Streptomyces violaceusniger]AEM84092.1 hypothetical protein Strvi_4461 [Streptomyces violaceusniger Tu 4113]
MSTHDVGLNELTEVVVRSQDNQAVRVRFCDRFRPDEDCVHYAIEACALGLHARVDEVVAWIWDADLAPFLEELARDFRGWDGERVWQNNDHDLTLRAVFRSGGHVGLTWTLRPWPTAAGGWEGSVTTWLEAGEQMSALATDLRHFLHGNWSDRG